MRGWLRSFLAWLDTRFPERVVITNAEFLKLKESVAKLEKLTANEDRILKLESEINKFNVAMGFGGSALPKGTVVPFQR